MDNKGLIFMPDISGYTRFINETEVNHSRLVIQELLETLIDSNQIGLELSEIEGDAILFYKLGNSPDMQEIYNQVEKMFCSFHRQLIAYDTHRLCQCRACSSAINLTLKIITHYGEFTGYNVKHHNKLIGKDIIIAHQLLKNDIVKHEYWLVTKSMLNDAAPLELKQWMHWSSSVKQTETGEIPFHYTQLSQLKSELKPDPLPLYEIKNRVKVLSITDEFDTDIITLFHATGDFNYRSRWHQGVKAVEEVNHFLPRVGMKSRFTMENGEVMIYSTSYSYDPDRIEFSETDEKKKNSTYYLLEKIGDNKTRLTLDMYIKRNPFRQLDFNLFKKKNAEEIMRQSFGNLHNLVKEIHLPPLSLP